jgi:hypothetical protein
VAPPFGFAIDLNGGEGPSRKALPAGGSVRYLDTGPLLKLIDAERGVAPATGDAEQVLREKLRILFDPASPRIERRGERVSMDSGVHVLAGMSHVIHALRMAPTSGGRGAKAAPLDESTIEAFDGATRTRTLAAWNAADFERGSVPETWQIRDRSDSGCRMRGKTADLNRVIPGSLLAMRDSETAPWTVVVVRRLRRLMVDHVEVGAEFIGSRPRYVKLLPAAREGEPRSIGALYLPPSEAFPAMPIRTLLLPAREYQPYGDLTLLSSNATYRLRLNDPIRHQMEFVWTSFTVFGKGAR